MAVAVEVGGRRDDAQDRVGSLRQVVDALGHGFRSGSSLSGSSIASSWPLPLDRKTRPIHAAPSSTDRPTPAAVAMIMWRASASPTATRAQRRAPPTPPTEPRATPQNTP